MENFKSLLFIFSIHYVFIFFSEAAPNNLSFPAFIAFGDSIIDTGMNNNLTTTARCNYPPYGKDFMDGKPSGRFTNGKTPVDFIVEILNLKEVLPAYLDPNLSNEDLLTGVNFASGGCGLDPISAKIALAYSLADQINFFKSYIEKLRSIAGEAGANNIITNGLYLLAASSNDIETAYFNSRIRQLQYDFPTYASILVGYATDFIKELYGMGARNFLIVSAPPLGCIPSTITLAGGGSKTRNCIDKYNQACELFNTKLSSAIDSLNNQLPKTRIVYVDIYFSLLELIQNPSNYGFEEVNKGCCGTGTFEVTLTCNRYSGLCPDENKYIFWDSFHPTEKAYQIVVSSLKDRVIGSAG